MAANGKEEIIREIKMIVDKINAQMEDLKALIALLSTQN